VDTSLIAPSLGTISLVTAHVVVLALAAWLYMRHLTMDRPPIGVFNRRDILIITVVIMTVPPLYLQLHSIVIAGLFSLVALVILQFTLAPLTRGRLAWLIALAIVVANIALALRGGGGETREPVFFAFNNIVIVVLVLGVANLWAQAGLRAREVFLFAMLLTVYDVVAVTWFPAMVEFFFRVVQLPFAPAVAWGDGPGLVGVGIGDLLVIALWVVVTEKAYGTRAAILAGASGVAAVGAILMGFWLGWVTEPVPAMIVLGPMVVLQYLLLRRIYGPERSTGGYSAARWAARGTARGTARDDTGDPDATRRQTVREPAALSGPDTVAGALSLLPDGAAGGGTNRYVAVAGSEVLAEAPTAAEALQEARQRRPGTVPVLMWTSERP
jgi:hypothetical protein